MANEIARKDLYLGLGNIKQRDWLKAAGKLGLEVTYAKSGTSHYTSLRKPSFDEDDIRGLVSTVTPNCYKQANQNIFKRVLAYCLETGKSEDDVWKALGMM
jgi:hypothetical protein